MRVVYKDEKGKSLCYVKFLTVYRWRMLVIVLHFLV